MTKQMMASRWTSTTGMGHTSRWTSKKWICKLDEVRCNSNQVDQNRWMKWRMALTLRGCWDKNRRSREKVKIDTVKSKKHHWCINNKTCTQLMKFRTSSRVNRKCTVLQVQIGNTLIIVVVRGNQWECLRIFRKSRRLIKKKMALKGAKINNLCSRKNNKCHRVNPRACHHQVREQVVQQWNIQTWLRMKKRMQICLLLCSSHLRTRSCVSNWRTARSNWWKQKRSWRRKGGSSKKCRVSSKILPSSNRVTRTSQRCKKIFRIRTCRKYLFSKRALHSNASQTILTPMKSSSRTCRACLSRSWKACKF